MADVNPISDAAIDTLLRMNPGFLANGSAPPSEAAEDDGMDEFRLKLTSGSVLFDQPKLPPAIWGIDDEIAWAEGQALTIFGPDGTAKTTIAGNLVRARLGITGMVLGYPVAEGKRNVLYMMMDRPAQAISSLARLFKPKDREIVTERLAIWKGPPLRDMATDTKLLTKICRAADADTCVIDSLKDAAIGLSKDEVGAAWHRSRSEALVAGIELIELNHPRKAQVGNARPDKLDDQFGSGWIGRGSGSIFSLWGEAGDPIIEVIHRKPPITPIPSFKMLVDHDTGEISIDTETFIDLVAQTALRGKEGMSAMVAANLMYGKTERRDVEKARRRLQALERKGLLTPSGGKGGYGGGGQVTWFAVGRHNGQTTDHGYESGRVDS